MLAVVGRDAEAKARAAGAIVLERVRRAGFELADSLVECLGAGDVVPGVVPIGESPWEVVLRVTVRDPRRTAVERFCRELAPLDHGRAAGDRRLCRRPALAPAGVRLLAGPRARVARRGQDRGPPGLRLVPRPDGTVSDSLRTSPGRTQNGRGTSIDPAGRPGARSERRQGEPREHRGRGQGRPRFRVPRAASHRGCGREYLAPLHVGRVRRYELPNFRAFNFVIERALAGGASRSLRLDTQGKALATALLEMRLPASPGDPGEGGEETPTCPKPW